MVSGETVLVIDKSAEGTAVTVSSSDESSSIVTVFFNEPSSVTLTLTIIKACEFAGILLIYQVAFLLPTTTVLLIKSAPEISPSSANIKPSGNSSTTFKCLT